MAAVWLWQEVVWIAIVLLIAVIIAVALQPVVRALEARGVGRAIASWGLVVLIVGALVGFMAVTWTSLASQAKDVTAQLTALEQQLQHRAPPAMVQVIRRSPPLMCPRSGLYAMTIGLVVLAAVGAFVLAWISSSTC